MADDILYSKRKASNNLNLNISDHDLENHALAGILFYPKVIIANQIIYINAAFVLNFTTLQFCYRG